MKGAFILDLEKPPTGKVSRQNFYVMISRGVSRQNMGIIRSFESSISVLTSEVDEEVIQNDRWLKAQDENTIKKYRNSR